MELVWAHDQNIKATTLLSTILYGQDILIPQRCNSINE